ncbi:MAG: phosphatase PAP2 family protein [Dehalococcoidia bacterium]|nr:phosphatase PAP2 family protein [Dehalococcoidia bacterium]
MLGLVIEVDQGIVLWISHLVGKSSILDGIMTILANDYFMPVTISLLLLYIWYAGRDYSERHRNQMAVVCSAITIGIAMGFILAANSIWRHPHPFQDLPQLLDPVTNHIFYPIHDPSFPSNSACLTFAAAAGIWQFNRKLGLIMAVPAILMPLAKLYAAVYYPSDIIGGIILGILTSYFVAKIFMPIVHVPISMGFLFLRSLRVG